MNSNIQSFDEFIETSNMSKRQLLIRMLESKSPAFVLDCIINNKSIDYLKESLFFQINESRPLLGDEIFAPKGVAIKGGAKRTKGHANGSGHGSLKNLGNTSSLYNNPSACKEIGEKIAALRDDEDNNLDARDYVGMINFLKASCDIATPIINRAKQEEAKLANQNESKEYDEFDEADDFEYSTSKSKFDDMIKKMSAALVDIMLVGRNEEDADELKDEYDDYMNNIKDSENGESEYFSADDAMTTNSYGKSIYEAKGTKGYGNGKSYSIGDLAVIRKNRGNGNGGLKSYVGKSSGQDLSRRDVKVLADKAAHIVDFKKTGIKTQEYNEAKDIVNKAIYMSYTCNIVHDIISGYVGQMSGSGISFSDFSYNHFE